MKKILLGLVALSAVSFAAQGDMYLNTRIGMDLGAKYDKISEGGLTDKTDGLGGEIALEGYKSITDNFDLGLGLAYQFHADRDTENIYDDGDKFKISGVEYDSIPVYLTAKYNFNLNSEIKPYLKADLGYSFNFNPSDFEASDGSHSEKAEMEVNNGLYWALGGGLEYNNFTVDLMYAVTTAESKPKDEDDEKDNDYGRVVLSAGYRFNL
ncbi:MAG: hypothetical protein B6227_02000 [Fusobacteriia bacterium 4572_74]|nr:MAG: hypothetical protein B6227_02000 [Fusobacteriia bacterium 4572_74]